MRARRVVLALALALGTACGGGEEPASAPSSPASEVQPAPPPQPAAAPRPAGQPERTRAAAAELLEQSWHWPEDAGPRPDLAADNEACAEELAADPAWERLQPLVQVKRAIECMKGKGWEYRPPR